MRQKKLKEKEQLTEKLWYVYGLWQSRDREQIYEKLGTLIKNKERKVKALKVQLDFHKKVLKQTHSEDIFYTYLICENLCKLLTSARLVNTPRTLA